MSSGSLTNNVIGKLFFYKSYSKYMSKQDLALNNPQEMICRKTNQPTTHSSVSFTWFALLSQQKFGDRLLLQFGALFDLSTF